uniref:DUF4806 domain-containing protein n=1 Tax=Strongyloides stercoralis TaxID=6248 RepID=A0A0K0ENF7_STRER
MRSSKAIKKRSVCGRNSYKNKARKKVRIRKKLLSYKRWKKATYSSNSPTDNFSDFSDFYDVLQKESSIYDVEEEDKLISTDTKSSNNSPLNIRSIYPRYDYRTSSYTPIENTFNTSGYHSTALSSNNVTARSMNHTVVTNESFVSGKKSNSGRDIVKGFRKLTRNVFQTVTKFGKFGSRKKGIFVDDFEGEEIVPRDMVFCMNMLDACGNDYDAMADSPKNVFYESVSTIKKRIKRFKKTPEYKIYKICKKEGFSPERRKHLLIEYHKSCIFIINNDW